MPAGRIIREKINATITPNAAKRPKAFIGGMYDARAIPTNPATVVNVVIVTGRHILTMARMTSSLCGADGRAATSS